VQGHNHSPIRKVLALTDDLITVAQEGTSGAADDGCLALYGLVLDCAYRIRAQAERERQIHVTTGLGT